MWSIQSQYGTENFFPGLEKELLSLVDGEKNIVANLANLSSWIYHVMPDLNWCGFYLWDESEGELVLGPFQGKPACLRIKPERGVCGASFREKRTLRVGDVHSFPGHIACDSQSRSELVIPLKKGDKIFGVLDLDSPMTERFSIEDERELEKIMNKVVEKIFY